MIKIRLKRFGKKREVSYRLVAMQSTSRRDGPSPRRIGLLQSLEPMKSVSTTMRSSKRLQQGAQPTETVRRILEKANLLERANPIAHKTGTKAS